MPSIYIQRRWRGFPSRFPKKASGGEAAYLVPLAGQSQEVVFGGFGFSIRRGDFADVADRTLILTLVRGPDRFVWHDADLRRKSCSRTRTRADGAGCKQVPRRCALSE